MSLHTGLVESFKEHGYSEEHSIGNSLGEFELAREEIVLPGVPLDILDT